MRKVLLAAALMLLVGGACASLPHGRTPWCADVAPGKACHSYPTPVNVEDDA